MGYLKTYENFKLEPHRNYNERKEFQKQKLIKILQNKSYDGDLYLKDTDIDSLYNLEEISGNIFLNKYIKDLKKLKIVNGELRIDNNQYIKTLKSLIYVKNLRIFDNDIIKDISNIRLDSLNISFTKISKIPNLSLYNNLYIRYNQELTKLPNNITEINDLLISECLNFSDLNNLKTVVNLTLKNLGINTLKNIKTAYSIDISNSKIDNLGKLKICNQITINEKQEYIKNIDNFFYTVKHNIY